MSSNQAPRAGAGLFIVLGLLLYVALLAAWAVPAKGAELKHWTAESDVATAAFNVPITLTADLARDEYKRVRIWIVVADDGDGGSATYAVKQCPHDKSVTACVDFPTAVSGTLTFGGTEVAVTTVFDPFLDIVVEVTANTVLVTVYVEALR